jgi:hypothetical protein
MARPAHRADKDGEAQTAVLPALRDREEDLPNISPVDAPTAPLRLAGSLDAPTAVPIEDTEHAAALDALHAPQVPDPAFLQRVLNGLRRL